MYTYVKSTCLSRSIGSQWSEVDLSDQLVYYIYSIFTKVYLELSNPVLAENVYVDMDTLRSEFSSYQGTLEQLLVELGDRNLETVEEIPSTEVKFARYGDALMYEYKTRLGKVGVDVPEGYPASDLHDLVMTRDKYATDMTLLTKHCLISVNGYYHMDTSTSTKTYVYRGGDTMRKANQNQVGILSFLDIGELTKVRLDQDNILPLEPNTPLKDKLIFTVEEDLTDKSCIFVLGGYLIFPQEGVFWRSGEKTFTLDLNRIPYVERLFESSKYLDLNDLELTESGLSPDAVNLTEVFSDRVIKNYLTLNQSFLVIVDVPYMSTNKIEVRHSALPGMFTSYQDPRYPLIVNYGKVAEYWKKNQNGIWSLTVIDSYLRNYVVSQQPTKNLQVVTDQFLAGQPFYHSRGFLLEISGYGRL